MRRTAREAGKALRGTLSGQGIQFTDRSLVPVSYGLKDFVNLFPLIARAGRKGAGAL